MILTYVNQYHFILRGQHLRLCKNCWKPFRHRVSVRLKNGNSYYGTLPIRASYLFLISKVAKTFFCDVCQLEIKFSMKKKINQSTIVLFQVINLMTHQARVIHTGLNIQLDAACCGVLPAVQANINKAGIFPSSLL